MSGQAVRALLTALEDAGVTVALSPAGDGLALSGRGRPPAELLEAVRAAKPALLEALRSPAKEEAAPASSSPPTVAPWEDLPPVPTKAGPPRPDWARVAAQPGHCGSCARFELAPEWGALMGTCGCPPEAWPGNLAPLAIHAGHRCAAYREEGQDVGQGYRAKRLAPSPRPAPQPRQVAP
ncbi:hypothetical protein [Deinococcus sp. YIM 77859]|uniref:hypothetical protein n=1 Tax=Deinococcus sp. YIM 77859 TaxID=1540221 RepID=UPI000558B776|nr:hypothetical protein [Deinococcus sp. YIM 77859]